MHRMLLLHQAHLGEVSVTVWPRILAQICAENLRPWGQDSPPPHPHIRIPANVPVTRAPWLPAAILKVQARTAITSRYSAGTTVSSSPPRLCDDHKATSSRCSLAASVSLNEAKARWVGP